MKYFKNFKSILKLGSILAVVAVFFLNVSIGIGNDLKIDTSQKAMAYMFTEANCFAGSLGGDLSYPKCNPGCPYELWTVAMQVGTCSSGANN